MNTMQMCWSDSTGTSMDLIKARSKELRRSAFFYLQMIGTVVRHG